MQNDNQTGNLLADMLAGSPAAITADYLQYVTAELSSIGNNVTADEINKRKANLPVATLINPHSGEVVATAEALKKSSKTPAGSFAHLHLQGVMLSQDFLWFRGVQHLAAELIASENNPNVDAVVLEVNSGGGQVVAGLILLSAMESMTKPVYVLAHYMGSAAVMGTLPASLIAASSPGVEVGSIGTMMQFSTSGLAAYKSNYKTMYAKKSSRKNSVFRALVKGEYDPAQKYLDETNEVFIQNVKKHRRVTADALTGEMFFAKDAKQKGLVDGVYSFNGLLKFHTELIRKYKLLTALNKSGAVAKKAAPRQVSTAAVRSTKTQVKSLPTPTAKLAEEKIPSYMQSPMNRKIRELAERKAAFEKGRELVKSSPAPTAKPAEEKIPSYMQSPMNRKVRELTERKAAFEKGRRPSKNKN